MKRFNVTGTCFKEDHYMVDTTNKINQIIKLIENNEYFVINRPRQYGKTTTLNLLKRKIGDDYIVIDLSFGAVSKKSYIDDKAFINMLYQNFKARLELMNEYDIIELLTEMPSLKNFNELKLFIPKFIKGCNKKVILFIDEVDDGTNNEVFIKFLGMLRDLYLSRKDFNNNVFQSVILAGVHDIKNLKFKVRDDSEGKFNSPWNIAVDFKVDMSFNPDEIETMLVDYNKSQPVGFKNNNLIKDTKYIANRIHYFTNGYPFLVSYMCKIIDEDYNADWSDTGIEKSIKYMLTNRNVNFDSVVKNIANNKDVYELVKSIVIDGDSIDFSPHKPSQEKAIMYGLIQNDNGMVAIHNRIYELIIYQFLSDEFRTNYSDIKVNNDPIVLYLNDDGSLDMDLIMTNYMNLMKSMHDNKQDKFVENNARLLFSLFVRPIINGTGFMWFEPVIGDRKRIDVVITYNEFKYVIELKIWNGPKYFDKAKVQLADYLDKEKLNEGYMLIHDFRKIRHTRYNKEIIEYNNKKLNIIYV